MKVGEKYVIEITDVALVGLDTRIALIGEFPIALSEKQLSQLEKLEDVIQEECDRVRKEPDHDGCKGCEFESDIFYNSTCEDCKRAYKDLYKPIGKEIAVGDEAIEKDSGRKCVVTKKQQAEAYVMLADGSYGWRKSSELEKTGKQYPYITEVLKQLEEVTNESD